MGEATGGSWRRIKLPDIRKLLIGCAVVYAGALAVVTEVTRYLPQEHRSFLAAGLMILLALLIPGTTTYLLTSHAREYLGRRRKNREVVAKLVDDPARRANLPADVYDTIVHRRHADNWRSIEDPKS